MSFGFRSLTPSRAAALTLALAVWSGAAPARGAESGFHEISGGSYYDKFGLAALDDPPADEPRKLMPELEKTAPFVQPEVAPEEGLLDILELRPAQRVIIRPIGSPWFLPGELGGSRLGDKPGPGIGVGMRWAPSTKWRIGLDLVGRAERVDSDNRLHDWTPYVCPGIDFIPYPNSKKPISFGIVFPIALASVSDRDKWEGVFLLIRWEEALSAIPIFRENKL